MPQSIADIDASGRLFDVVRCLACGGVGTLAPTGDAVVCRACAASYAVEAGIPLLVRDWTSHRSALETADRERPGWYEDEQPPEEASPWRHHIRKRRRYVSRILADRLRRSGRDAFDHLLDLGCGDGNNLVWLAPFARRISGTDYNLLRLARARRRMPDAALALGDALDHPFADGTVDAVFFNHVIEHIPDDLGALASVRRLLRPGGLLVLGTPNEGCWWWQTAYRRDPESLRNTDHVHFYTARTIEAKLLKAGFSVSAVHHMGWGPPDWSLDGRIRRHKWVDDGFEWVGRALFPGQASSLYLIAEKPREDDGRPSDGGRVQA